MWIPAVNREWLAKNALYIYAITSGLASGLMAYALYYSTGRGSFWGITTGESKIGGLAWSYFIDPGIADTYYHQIFKLANPLSDPTQMIVIGILLGGFLASLASGEFTIRHFPNSWMVVQALIGGFLLGYGARMALGCNIGNYLSAWSSAGVNAVAFTAGMMPGAWVGTFIVERVFLFRVKPSRFNVTLPVWVQRFLLLPAALALTALLFYSSVGVAVKLWFVFGVIFGLIGYLSKICWATGFREITNPLYGGGRMLLATALAILSYTLLTWPLIVLEAPISLALARGVGVLQVFLGGF
ncbi:MAG: YeeE/YedE thiosulfate transporter family protein [Thermoprotei archaeon]|nr:YeeE/YedE thiosulfate transporter family protein [Thermoprotei archaeon]